LAEAMDLSQDTLGIEYSVHFQKRYPLRRIKECMHTRIPPKVRNYLPVCQPRRHYVFGHNIYHNDEEVKYSVIGRDRTGPTLSSSGVLCVILWPYCPCHALVMDTKLFMARQAKTLRGCSAQNNKFC
jgi:hypothetical protein